MNDDLLNSEQLELLAAGYVLEDLDLAEKKLLEQLIPSSAALRARICESIALKKILATLVDTKGFYSLVLINCLFFFLASIVGADLEYFKKI